MHPHVSQLFAALASARRAVPAVAAHARAFLQVLPGHIFNARTALAPWFASKRTLLVLGVALALTLLLLALPRSEEARVLASVELPLGQDAKTAPRPAWGSEITLALLPPLKTETPEEASKEESEPEPADLQGLAEIPEELIAKENAGIKDRPRRRPIVASPVAIGDKLPWDAAEPVSYRPMGPGELHKPGEAVAEAGAAPEPAKISAADIGRWTKGKATKIKGADRERPLYHFVVWLEPPVELKQSVTGVSYDFSSPAVQPQSQASSDRNNKFKINVAGLACADEITVTLRFADGRKEQTSIDGCKLFDKA